MNRLTLPALAAAAFAALVAACAHGPPPPPVPPARPTVAPHAATGVYDLTTTLPRSQPAQPARGARARGRQARPAPDPTPTLELAFRPLAALDATAMSNTQLSATINLPGYTRAPRGRSGQAAAWWPLPGDSVIVHFQPPQQRSGTIELRGALKGETLEGDIWYTSLATGNSFQMGSFRAVKRRT